MRTAVITHFRRSPFHFASKGALTRVRADDLAAQVIAKLVADSGIDAADIEDLIVGCAFPEGEQGFNLGRILGFLSHLPISVAGTTVNRFCGSSMQAIHMATGAIAVGAGDAFICAGVESMTHIPIPGYNPLPNPKLMKEYPQAYISMGETAENLARKYQITRGQQEEMAVASHRKAAAAQAAGKFDEEIVPIDAGGSIVKADGTIRPDTNAEALAGLKPAFDVAGTVTAGTSSPLTDGASAVLVVSEEYAKAHGLKPLARIKSTAVAGCAPEIMGIGPVPATQKALERAGISLKDIDVVELNEAFAAQSLSVVHDLGIDQSKMNIDGGALALGHPLGASGARITGKAAQLLKREGKSLALATMCIGGGQGIATVLEAV
ncbi:MAG TPA: thiolase family protein [Alphaproteobacteria bacterium]|nr:thiolase family protein [Alphaproteobacteria bacterium]